MVVTGNAGDTEHTSFCNKNDTKQDEILMAC